VIKGEINIMEKPRQGFWGLWNISFGFFGIQIGFALQNANASRIFQSLGSSVENLGLMWMAAPLTGLLVQPIIGHYSDRTWGPLGRRRPYFLAGAILCALSLFYMPVAPFLMAAAITLWVLDASLNVSMEPFRAFVGDMLGKAQRPTGYGFQTAFIGAGAVVASLMPFLLEKLGVSNIAPAGMVPDTVKYSFWFGGIMLFAAVLWTVLSTREYPPEQLAAFSDGDDFPKHDGQEPVVAPRTGLMWIAIGAAFAAAAALAGLAREAFLVAGLLAAYGLLQMAAVLLKNTGRTSNILSQLISDMATMPQTMRQLALVQFFTWGALIIMWVYTTPVVAQYVYGAPSPSSAGFNEAGNWVGIMFAVYNGVAALFAFLLPKLARSVGAARTHLLCLAIGALAYASLLIIRDKTLLLLPMVGIGIVWASVLTMPYVILAGALPPRKMGVYMGIFNFFIVLPQLIIATLMGGLMNRFFHGEPIWTMLIAAIVMALAAFAMLRVKNES
jgi:maltose/moltooligosaccharide transporter